MRKLLLVLGILSLFATASQAQFAGQSTYVVGGGTGNAQTATISNVTALGRVKGVPLHIMAGASNAAGAMTLQLNSLTATAVKRQSSGGLINPIGGETVSGQIFTVIYDGTVFELIGPPSYAKAPTYQVFTSGSGSYTPATGVSRIKVRMIGPGGSSGGAAASGATAGSAGTDTSFNSVVAKAGNPGQPSTSSAAGAGGGVSSTGAGSASLRIPGGAGGYGMIDSVNNGIFPGGSGCASTFGGAGIGITATTAPGPGVAAVPNTGSGASGGGANQSSYQGAGGGGCGEYVELVIQNPGVISYVVGAAGTAGTGTQAGALGGSGIVIVEESY